MTNMEAIKYFKFREKFLADIDLKGLEAHEMAINALGSIEQIKWERDVAIEQLNELGLGLGQKVETLNLHPTEAVVVYFNFDNIHLDELNAFYEMLQDKFPNNAVVVCPDKISLQSWSKDVLENYISMIQEIIDGL